MEHDPNHLRTASGTTRDAPSVAVEGPSWIAHAAPQRQDRLVVTVSEAAALLGISRAFAYELVARGELPVIRLGRRRLVPKVALLALVEKDDSISSVQ